MGKTVKFNGGMYPTELKEQWEKQATKDGFPSLWPWLRWLAQQRVNEFNEPGRKTKHNY